MEKIKDRLERCVTARPHTDLQSEVINVIAAPIYLYTITGVFYYNIFFIMPYYYGSESWTLFFQRSFLTVVYFQMMSNWLCIRLVDNSLKTDEKHFGLNKRGRQKENESDLDSVIVNGTNGTMQLMKNGKNAETIPGPVSAPPPPQRSSYWSSRMCKQCELTAPPRCHHCPFCNNCILKRDHHCFFTRRCIGFYNQRHFVVFLVCAVFGTAYTSIYFMPYLFNVVLVSKWDIFAPFALLRACLGYSSFHTANVMLTFTLNLLFVLLSSTFIQEQFELIRAGITQFEQKKVDTNRLVISDPRPFTEKLKSVLGYYYGLSFIFPFAHLLFLPHENPFEWPEHKIYRK